MSSYSSAFDEALTKPLVTTKVNTNHKAKTTALPVSNNSITNTAKPHPRGPPPPESFPASNPFEHGYNPPALDEESQQSQRQQQPHGHPQQGHPLPNDDTMTSMETQSQSLLLHNDGTSQHSELEVALLQERHEETVQIHSNMRTIRDIHLDLATLVEGQQDMVDEVETNAEQVYQSAQSGTT